MGKQEFVFVLYHVCTEGQLTRCSQALCVKQSLKSCFHSVIYTGLLNPVSEQQESIREISK